MKSIDTEKLSNCISFEQFLTRNNDYRKLIAKCFATNKRQENKHFVCIWNDKTCKVDACFIQGKIVLELSIDCEYVNDKTIKIVDICLNDIIVLDTKKETSDFDLYASGKIVKL